LNIEVEEYEESASSEKRGTGGPPVSTREREHPARFGACGDGVGAAGLYRPIGTSCKLKKQLGLDAD
jgi:hypothetical protein